MREDASMPGQEPRVQGVGIPGGRVRGVMTRGHEGRRPRGRGVRREGPVVQELLLEVLRGGRGQNMVSGVDEGLRPEALLEAGHMARRQGRRPDDRRRRPARVQSRRHRPTGPVRLGGGIHSDPVVHGGGRPRHGVTPRGGIDREGGFLVLVLALVLIAPDDAVDGEADFGFGRHRHDRGGC